VLTLSGISTALSVAASDRVVLKKSARVNSTGQAGGGGFASAGKVEYNITLDDNNPRVRRSKARTPCSPTTRWASRT
jgi:hypothetical protein